MVDSEVLAAADCEQVVLVRDRSAGATVLVVVHDTALGPAHGGIRRWAYPSLAAASADAVALATAMTWKCALAGVPAGGGKCVVLDHPGLDRAAAYRLVGRTVEELGGRYFTGPDVGTTDADLRLVAERTRYVALDRHGEGPGDLAGATADGVLLALQAALAVAASRDLAGTTVAVQGLGAVGAALCERLAARSVRLVVADVLPARAAAVAQRCGATVVEPAAIVRTPCDVFAPCALGGVLTAAIARELPARIVCGAANNVFADDDASAVLHARGIVAVPDFVANAGALILGATWHLTGRRAAPDAVARIGATTRELLERAAASGQPPLALALAMARERVRRGRP